MSAIRYIERSKLFENWVSQKTHIKKLTQDVEATHGFIAIQNDELKKVQEEANKRLLARPMKRE